MPRSATRTPENDRQVVRFQTQVVLEPIDPDAIGAKHRHQQPASARVKTGRMRTRQVMEHLRGRQRYPLGIEGKDAQVVVTVRRAERHAQITITKDIDRRTRRGDLAEETQLTAFCCDGIYRQTIGLAHARVEPPGLGTHPHRY